MNNDIDHKKEVSEIITDIFKLTECKTKEEAVSKSKKIEDRINSVSFLGDAAVSLGDLLTSVLECLIFL